MPTYLLNSFALQMYIELSDKVCIVLTGNGGDQLDEILLFLVQGPILCLAQANVFLFSGGQDTTIKVWKFDTTAQAFQPLVCPHPCN